MRRANRRPPAELQNDTSFVENVKDIYMVTKSTNVYYIYDKSDPRVGQTAVRVRSKSQDEWNSITLQRRRQTT